MCRTRDNPEGFTQPQKWRKGNCRLRQEAEPKGRESQNSLLWLVRTWLDSAAGRTGHGAVLRKAPVTGHPRCWHSPVPCFITSFHNKAAETSLARTRLSQHGLTVLRKAPRILPFKLSRKSPAQAGGEWVDSEEKWKWLLGDFRALFERLPDVTEPAPGGKTSAQLPLGTARSRARPAATEDAQGPWSPLPPPWRSAWRCSSPA